MNNPIEEIELKCPCCRTTKCTIETKHEDEESGFYDVTFDCGLLGIYAGLRSLMEILPTPISVKTPCSKGMREYHDGDGDMYYIGVWGTRFQASSFNIGAVNIGYNLDELGQAYVEELEDFLELYKKGVEDGKK